MKPAFLQMIVQGEADPLAARRCLYLPLTDSAAEKHRAALESSELAVSK